MTTHTPGPWTIERRGFAEVYSGNVLVADVLIESDSADGCGDANARLIAAAPDMKDGLKKYGRHLVGTCCPVGLPGDDGYECRCGLDALLASIEGTA